MSQLTTTRAVAFDFNGTLCDDEEMLFGIFGDLFNESLGWSLPRSDYYGRLAGLSDREIVRIVVGEHRPGDDELVNRLLAERGQRYRDRVQERPPLQSGARELLEALAGRGVALAVVTGAQRADVKCVLESAGLNSSFDAVVTVEDVVHGKPNPEGFERAAGLLDVAPSSVVVVEDSVAGIRAAHAAGMRCIALAGTHDRSTLEPEGAVVVDRLSTELLDHI